MSDGLTEVSNSRIYGNYVVWADNVGGDWDIYLRDLNDGTQSLIISETQNQYSPRIYGDYIVYIII